MQATGNGMQASLCTPHGHASPPPLPSQTSSEGRGAHIASHPALRAGPTSAHGGRRAAALTRHQERVVLEEVQPAHSHRPARPQRALCSQAKPSQPAPHGSTRVACAAPPWCSLARMAPGCFPHTPQSGRVQDSGQGVHAYRRRFWSSSSCHTTRALRVAGVHACMCPRASWRAW